MSSVPAKLVDAKKKSNKLTKALGSLRPEDREFLPAALELLETPPSPVKIGIGLTICGLAALTLAWSFVGKLDVYATSHGLLVTETQPNVVQSLATGKIKTIQVQNGSHVEQDAVLATLDPADAEADATANMNILNSNSVEVIRRQAEIQVAQEIKRQLNVEGFSSYDLLTTPKLEGLGDAPIFIASREQQNLETDLAELHSSLLNLDQQIAQSEATRDKSEASIAADQKVIEAEQSRMDVQDAALQKQVGTKLSYIDAQENLARGRSQLTNDQGQRAEAIASIAQLRGQKIKLIDQIVADNQTKMTDAARKADDAKQQLAKANAKLQLMTLRAPASGTVEGLSLVSVGQVVTSGQQAMTITPDGQNLEARVYISNGDFGFIQEGQEATLKVDAYPFTQYGTIKGHVFRIATDALSQQDAERLQTKPTSLANSGNYSPTPAAPGQGENLVFPVTISVLDQTLNFRGRDLPLKPGMTVEVEIKTDTRRIIDYLISPIRKITSEAMHER